MHRSVSFLVLLFSFMFFAPNVLAQDNAGLTLGGSFLGQAAPNIVTRSVSLNIDGLTNAQDAFNILNRGDGKANFTRNLDSVEYLTNDNYIQNSLYFNRTPQKVNTPINNQ